MHGCAESAVISMTLLRATLTIISKQELRLNIFRTIGPVQCVMLKRQRLECLYEFRLETGRDFSLLVRNDREGKVKGEIGRIGLRVDC